MSSETLGEYLRSIRFYIAFMAVFFLFSIAVGYMGMFNSFFENPSKFLKKISSFIDMPHISPWTVFLLFFALIFLNNTLTCFLAIFTGPLIGIFPIFSVFLNGGLIGWFARVYDESVFILILPHGVFEIPAFLISTAIGLRLAREVFKPADERELKVELGRGLYVFVRLIVPLLLIAALIESSLIVISYYVPTIIGNMSAS